MLKILGKKRTISKSLAVLFVLYFVFVQLFMFAGPVAAASSPWGQTDWSGGSGQTSWSDATMYSAASGLTAGASVALTATSSWYDTDYRYRKKITFDNSAQAENLENFPVLVKLTSSNFDFSKAQSAGQDIRFTDSNGTTLLKYEIEDWDSLGSQAWVWVKVPQIDASSSTDNIYMYYGNSGVSDAQTPTEVWDSNFKAVYHLNETGSGVVDEYEDSTSNNNDGQGGGGTGSRVPTRSASGQIGYAQSFDSANSTYISVPSEPVGASPLNITGDITIEIWTKPSNLNSSTQQLLEKGTGANAIDRQYGIRLSSANQWATYLYYSTGTYLINDTVTAPSTSRWDYISAIRTSNSFRHYTNTTDGGNNTISGATNATDNILAIGRPGSGSFSYYSGLIDEIRISSTARSTNWTAATYKSGQDTFNTYGTEEQVYSVGSGTLTSSIFDSGFSGGALWGVLTYSATEPANTSASVKIRTSDSPTMSGATAFASCSAISSSSDISADSCVSDGDRYVQYQISLANTDSVSTPAFTSFSLTFAENVVVTPSAPELDGPGTNSYTNSERPSFKWKVPADTSGISKYVFNIDNPSIGSSEPSGDFTIDNIEASRTTNFENNRYVIQYENFSDSDSNNNYIVLTTKSSSDWGSSENDGKLREGRVVWDVQAVGSDASYSSTSRVLFVDRTNPAVGINQINEAVLSSTSFVTNDATPTFFGKITDSLSGGDQTLAQDENGPRVASGPDKVEIKIEKKSGAKYYLYSLYTLNFDNPWYTCGNIELNDSSKQKCGKYLPFGYTPKDSLVLGDYKVTTTGRDKAGNISSEVSFTLRVGSLNQVVTQEEKDTIIQEETKDLQDEEKVYVEDNLEVTKPLPPSPEKRTQSSFNLFSWIGNLFRGLFGAVQSAVAFLGDRVAGLAFGVGNGVRGVSNSLGLAIVQFGYNFTSEPTKIYDVKVDVLSPSSARISWTTNHPATGKVNYGLDETYPYDIQTAERSTHHEFILEDLKPDTEYSFEVMSQNKNYVYDANRKFTTEKE